jgi:hypothetical protein
VSERNRPVALISVIAVAALVIATGVAIVVTQHLRDQGPVVSSTRFKTRPDGTYRICFKLTRDDTVQVAIVNAGDQVVRVLAPSVRLSGSEGAPDTPKAGAHCFDWDGSDSSGQPAPAGVYRMRLSFLRIDRVLTPGEHRTIAARGAPS